jgi:hypothetical protein
MPTPLGERGVGLPTMICSVKMATRTGLARMHEESLKILYYGNALISKLSLPLPLNRGCTSSSCGISAQCPIPDHCIVHT